MIVAYKLNHEMEAAEPILAYDPDEGELWGIDRHFDPAYVGLSAEEFAHFFPSPRFVVQETDEDPFADEPEPYKEYLRNYPPGSEDVPDVPTIRVPERVKRDNAAEKVADSALERFEGLDPGGGTGNAKKAADGDSAVEYERCDDILREMHKNLAEWDGEDLSKAPAAWPSDDEVPKFVEEAVIEAIQEDKVVWEQFSGYSKQTAEAIRNSLQENITQPQGWSIGSLVDDMLEMYPGMDQKKALNIARTEVSAILNSAREEAYERREDSDYYVYYWQGPADHRRTKVCEEISEEVEARGGAVPMEELRSILRSKAKKYKNTQEGGTPERVSEWTPHYQCRHTFIRDVKADL